ncbi:methyltransferase domain-containing protein [Parasediminibacterium sp. JCM 36343]|uniref:methyltransferase domain-containing protein n=1 Tax=Parasediminibacterium sp. JCM 36343 TaxID=3374279 RepID=UPI003978CCE4
MPDFKQRSAKKELLDQDGIPFEDIRQNMRELDMINTWLGGHGITLQGIKALMPLGPKNPVSICEIGCGGGDNLHAIAKELNMQGILFKTLGIDIKKECLETAHAQYKNDNAVWVQSDYKKVRFAQPEDIIFSSLFCHHFSNEALVEQLKWMHSNCSKGFFINDLHRHWLAYYSIKFITRLFSKSYLVKNDAPLSVLRGFTKKEWIAILQQAGISNYTIQWKWAFRHLIVVKK